MYEMFLFRILHVSIFWLGQGIQYQVESRNFTVPTLAWNLWKHVKFHHKLLNSPYFQSSCRFLAIANFYPRQWRSSGVCFEFNPLYCEMNPLKNVVPCYLFYSVYMDDIQVSLKSRNGAVCETHVKIGVNRLSNWATENGFRLDAEKSTGFVF